MNGIDDGTGEIVMSIGQLLRKLVGRVRGRLRPEQAESGIDKAADKLDQATGGKYRSRVDKGRKKAKDAANKYLRGEK